MSIDKSEIFSGYLHYCAYCIILVMPYGDSCCSKNSIIMQIISGNWLMLPFCSLNVYNIKVLICNKSFTIDEGKKQYLITLTFMTKMTNNSLGEIPEIDK